MPKYTYGSDVKARVKRLLEALLAFANLEFEESFNIEFKWEAEDSTNPKLIVKTTLVTLELLTEKDTYPGKLTKPQIREALNLLKDFLNILEDNRTQTKGVDTWHFTLTLWSKNKENNLKQFEQAWENSRPEKSKALEASCNKSDAFGWHNICLAMLEAEKRLTTNQFMRDDDERFDLDDIHVPLALVERKKQDKRGEEILPEQGSRLYEPEYEEKQRFEHEQFLQDVLKNAKGKHIAIIGEPGAGKTTLLRKIAFWVQDKTEYFPIEYFPISISLADLQEFTLEDYLLRVWLKKALKVIRVKPEMEDALYELFKSERVWLMLDGVDEMPVQGEQPLWAISNQLKGWVGQARVVLSCRLNVWEANRNVLADNFEIYRTLEFSYGDSTTTDKVGDFIGKWFKRQPNLGQQLRQALDEPGKERIKDLVKNPLRLALLCSTWNLWREHGGLPDTKAKLYQGFVEKFYQWKSKEFPTYSTQQEQLNQALGELAKLAIDQTASRFRLKHSLVCQVLGKPDEPLYKLAVTQLSWLNKVGLAAESPDETVYAFWHPTFEEYFAACAIEDWHFFLNHVPQNPKQGIYRIFEKQWKEVILLWLGRQEEGLIKQKEEFIKALVEFDDRCGDFYRYRAYFLAAAGIAEFNKCSYTDEIVKQVIEWKFGEVTTDNNKLYLPIIIKKSAKKTLLEMHYKTIINALNKQLKYRQIQDDFPDLAMTLLQIAPGHSGAIKLLVNYLYHIQQEFERSKKTVNFHHVTVIGHLKKFGGGHPLATAALAKLSQSNEQNKQTPSESDISQLNLPTGNAKDVEKFILLMAEIDRKKVKEIIRRLDDINTLVILLKRKPILSKYSHDLEEITTLINLFNSLDTTRSNLIFDFIRFINSLAVDRLAEIAANQPNIVPTLKEIMSCNHDNKYLCQQIIRVLGKAASKSINATNSLVQILTTTQEYIIALDAIYFLKTVIKSDLLAVVVIGLKDYIQDSEGYEIIWHCAQNMPYPDFYEAWHNQSTASPSSLNLANLPQVLAEAINNQPELCSKVKLICIDIHQFIDPENPAPEIYDLMLNQNCPEWQNGYPETMQKLKLYWNYLRRNSENPLFFICYDSTALTATPTGFSDTFLKALSKFDGAICVVTSPPNPLSWEARGSKNNASNSVAREEVREWGSLQWFSPSQPDLVAAVVAWIQQSLLENRHPI